MNTDEFDSLHDEKLQFDHLTEDETQDYVNNYGCLSALVKIHRYAGVESYRNDLEKWINCKKYSKVNTSIDTSREAIGDVSEFLKLDNNCIYPNSTYTQKNDTIIYWVDNGICGPLTPDMTPKDIIVVAAKPLVKYCHWSIKLCPLSKTSMRKQNKLYDEILFIDVENWFKFLRENNTEHAPTKEYCNIRIRTDISMHVVKVEHEKRNEDGKCTHQDYLWSRN